MLPADNYISLDSIDPSLALIFNFVAYLRIYLKQTVLIILILLVSTSIYSQNHSLEFNYHQGQLITHRSSIAQEIRGLHPKGLSLSIIKRYSGEKAWHQNWGIPSYGFTVGYFNLDQNEILGHVFYINALIRKSFINSPSKHNIALTIAPGISMHTKKYDKNTNDLNTLNSQAINLNLNLSLEYSYRLGTDLSILVGAQLSHFSNASTRFPNIGINVPHFKTGIRYTVGNNTILSDKSTLAPFNKSSHWLALVNTSVKSAGQEYNTLDWAYSISCQRISNIHRLLSVLFSADYMYNNTIKKVLDRDNANQSRIGVTAGYQLEFGKSAFIMQLGYYIYRPEKDLNEPVYHRFGLKHQIHDKWIISGMLKSHKVRADVFELGLGRMF